MDTYSVFYLVGGSANFVCKALYGKFPFNKATEEVESLKKSGYKAMAVKNGHLIGGYCSFSDFTTKEQAQEYYKSIT